MLTKCNYDLETSQSQGAVLEKSNLRTLYFIIVPRVILTGMINNANINLQLNFRYGLNMPLIPRS